ncbi:MAG: mechanosensitive ion channel domain-containing protein [Acidobacteriota bacterium]
MPRNRAGRVILGVLVLCLLLVAGQGFGATQADEQGLWHSIADGLTQNIAIKRQELQRMRQHLPEQKAKLAADLSGISSRLDQLLLLRGVAGETPWASRTLLLEIGELTRAVQAARGPLEDMQDTLGRTKQEYATLRQIRSQNASREYADLINEELSGPGRQFKELKHDVDAVKDEVDAALAQATALSSDIDTVRAEEKDRFIMVFSQTYFESAGSLLRPSNLAGMVDDLLEWADAGPRFWGPVLSFTPWGAFLGLTAGFAALALLVLRFPLRRRPESWLALRPGLACLAVAAGLLAARYSVLFAANQFTSLVFVIFIATGLFWLAVSGGRVLPVLYASFLAGVGMDVSNLPASVVCALWPLAAGAGFWRLFRADRRSLALWLLGLSGMASLLGFGPQAVMTVQAFFMLHLAVYVSGAVQRWLAKLGGDRERSLANLAQPLAVTVLAALFIAWVLIFMGGPGLVDYVFSKTFALGKAAISLDALSGLVISFFLLRLIQAWFQEGLTLIHFRGKPMDTGLAHTVGAAFCYITWLLFILFALHLFAVPLGAVTWIASGLSVGIGFGLKDIVNNFISGLIIMFGGAVKKGDIIQQGKNLGEVVDLSVRNTIMRTLDNTTVIIPNSSFLRGEIVNLSYHDATMRLTIPVTVAPGTKIKKVRKLLTQIAKEHPDVLKKPAPEVLLRSFGRLGLEFDLQVWIENFLKKFQVQSELATTIDQVFQDNKILVPFQGVKVKYKPKGSEAMQLEANREALRQKRSEVFGKVRLLRRTHARRRWPAPAATGAGEE